MSTEEKARAYDEALERAKKQSVDGYLDAIAVEEIFPQLRESEDEDERIRKVIYKLMLGMREEIFTSQDEIVTKEKALAYLEKKPDIKIWPHEIIDAKNGEHDPADIYSEDGRLIAKKDESEDEKIRKWVIEELEITRYAISGKNHYSDDPYIVARLKHLDEALDWLGKQKESLHISETCKENPDSFTDEDERIIQNLIDAFTEYKKSGGVDFHGIEINTLLAWLEKQKELTPADGWDYADKRMSHHLYWEGFEAGMAVERELSEFEKQKEQKPNSTEDMPYITDEHFYEREPVDSFKYKLAEYMTRCCTKKEGPYGYEYGISAESILKMAEEELLKRGVVQKPAEWSEVDEIKMNALLNYLDPDKGGTKYSSCAQLTEWYNWLKSLRPSWKPSEEQMEALAYASQVLGSDLSPRVAKASEELEGIREHFKKL